MVAGWLRPFVPAGGALLDLGGGTGDLGAGVARALDASVVVADATSPMLRRVSPDPRVSVRLTTAESLPFSDASFDAVLCSDAFHHFRDQDAAVREMARVVRPGGGVVLLEVAPLGWARPVVRLERLLGEPAAFKTAPELETYLAQRGVVGTTARHGGPTYSFVGMVPFASDSDFG